MLSTPSESRAYCTGSRLELPGDFAGDVCMITGIHGVGKTSLVTQLANELPGTAVLHASQEIRLLLGGVSREQQMKMKLDDWLGSIVARFTLLFDRGLNENDRVLFDTHLLVPVPGEQGTIYKTTWSDEYRKYIGSAFMLVAEPSTIAGWHRNDETLSGRKREVTVSQMTLQQKLNVDEFDRMIESGILPQDSQILENRQGRLNEIKDTISARLLAG